MDQQIVIVILPREFLEFHPYFDNTGRQTDRHDNDADQAQGFLALRDLIRILRDYLGLES